MVQTRERKQRQQRGQEDEGREDSHGTQTVEVGEQTGDRGSRQHEDEPASARIPVVFPQGCCFHAALRYPAANALAASF